MNMDNMKARETVKISLHNVYMLGLEDLTL